MAELALAGGPVDADDDRDANDDSGDDSAVGDHVQPVGGGLAEVVSGPVGAGSGSGLGSEAGTAAGAAAGAVAWAGAGEGSGPGSGEVSGATARATAGAGGASGRTVRSSMEENAAFPGASDLFAAMTQTFRDSGRRHDDEMKLKRIEVLSRLLDKQPDMPGISEQLRKLLE